MNPERYPYNVRVGIADLPGPSGPQAWAIDHSLIEVVSVSDVDTTDYPDFCDAWISEATYDGRPMTDAELDALNEDREFVSAAVHDWIMR